MPFWVAAAATVVGAGIQADSSRRASNTQRDAARDANRTQWDMYQQSRADYAPWRQAGNFALSQMVGGMSRNGGGAPSVLTGRRGGRGNPQMQQRYGGQPQARIPYTQPTQPSSMQAQMIRKDGGDPEGQYLSELNQPAGAAPQAGMTQGVGGGGWSDGASMSISDLSMMPQGGNWEDNYAVTDDAGYQDVARDFSLSDFQTDPGYQFRMQQGQDALQNSAAANGSLMGGDTGRALIEYGQNFASNEFQNAFQRYQANRGFRAGAYQDAYNRFGNERNTRFNQLSTLAGFGQNATNNTAQLGSNAANQSGQNAMYGANARAAGQMGQANAWTSGLSGAANAWSQYQARQPQQNYQPNWAAATPGNDPNTLSNFYG